MRVKLGGVLLAAVVAFLAASGSTWSARGAAAEWVYPLSVAAGDSGPIYFADRNLPGIWKLDGETLSVLFQADKKFRTPLNAVRCVALDRNGKLLAGDTGSREVYRFGDDGKPVPLTNGGIGMPMSIAVNQAGELLVADLEKHQIVKVPAAGGAPVLFAKIPAPCGLAVDKQDRVWVVSRDKDPLWRISSDGKEVETLLTGRPFAFPHNLVVDGDDTAYITDGYAKAVWKFVVGQEPTKLVEKEPLVFPEGIASRDANLLVIDPKAKTLFKITFDGKISAVPVKPAGN